MCVSWISPSHFPRKRNKSLGEVGIKVDNDQRMEIDPRPTSFRENVATADDWMKALNKVVPTVVILNPMACCDFDTESIGASYTTEVGWVSKRDCGLVWISSG